MQLCNNRSCLYSKKSRKHHTIYPWLFTSQCLNSSFKIWSSFHLHSSFSWWWSNQTRFWLVVHKCNSFKLNQPQSCKLVKPNFRIQICAVVLFNLIQHWRANESNSHIGLNLYRSATTGGWHVDNLLSPYVTQFQIKDWRLWYTHIISSCQLIFMTCICSLFLINWDWFPQ